MARRRGSSVYGRAVDLGSAGSRSTAGTRRPGNQEQANQAQSEAGEAELPKFSPLWATTTFNQIKIAPTMQQALSLARGLNASAYFWIRSYGDDYVKFRLDWMVARNYLPLQVRLSVEQVLWGQGEPWKRLITGFKAID